MTPNERMKMFLAELSEKKIPMDEFLLKCAEWTAEDIDEYVFKPLPVRPAEMEKLDAYPEDQRHLLNTDFYNTYPQILNYIRLNSQIKWENKTLYDWLMECRKLLIRNDKIEMVEKIDQKLVF